MDASRVCIHLFFLDASRVCIHLCFWPKMLFSLNFWKCSYHFFWGGISALGLFYLSALLGCCLLVLIESRGCRVILLLYYLILIQKITKIFASLHHYASLDFAFCMVLALGLLGKVLVRISYRNGCFCHLKENFAFHVVAYPVFHLTQCICIDC